MAAGVMGAETATFPSPADQADLQHYRAAGPIVCIHFLEGASLAYAGALAARAV